MVSSNTLGSFNFMTRHPNTKRRTQTLKLLSVSVMTAGLLFFGFSPSCFSDDSALWQDWQVTISMQSFSPYLDYPESKIRNLTKASVVYSQPASDSQRLYKDFYFAPSRIIGARRSGELEVKAGTAGVIKVNCTDCAQCYGAANVVGRMWLDLFLERCPTKYVVVPKAFYSSMIAAMCSQGFQAAPPIPARKAYGLNGTIMLTVISDPPGLSQDIMM